MKTLKNILDVPQFSDWNLLTTHVDLDITITSAEITDTPDIAKFTSSGTLILTTGMYYQKNQQGFFELIDSLSSIQCAGLAIKIGRFIDDIQPEIIQYANERNFPLITIPVTKPLGIELEKISNYIHHNKAEQINYALDIQKQFSNLIINDAPISKIISELNNILQCPTMLLNPFKEVVASSNDLKQMTQEITKQLLEQEAFEQKNTTKTIQYDTHLKLETAILPIKSNNYFPYYLIILSPEKVPYPVSEFTIEQALLILSFVLLKNDKVEESQKQIKSDYFYNLIERQEHKISESTRWLAYDIHFGIRFSHFYQVIYVSLRQSEKEGHFVKLNEEKMNLAYLWLQDKLPTYFDDSVIFPEKNTNNLIILLQKKISSHKIELSLIHLTKELKKVLPIEIVFSSGQSCETFEKISSSFIEAKIMYEERKTQNIQKLFTAYRPKGILNLFDSIQPDETRYFCQNILKDLAYPTDTMYQELRKTLKTFLDNQCEITKTANELFIHRNTVKYRIENCESMLGLTIDTPQNSLNLRLALELSNKANNIEKNK